MRSFEPSAANRHPNPDGPPPPGDERSEHRDDLAAFGSRRAFLMVGLGFFLAGCGTQRASSPTLPGPSWRVSQGTPPPPTHRDHRPMPQPAPSTVRAGSGGVIARAGWTNAPPAPSIMNRMGPVRFITVHHDGISPFYETEDRAAAGRLESIRRYHRETLGWGDIGYHYAIDRAGRVWECRPMTFQGAHVRNHNESNIGVMLLGHFDQQSPSERQLDALHHHVSGLMKHYGVPISRVATHREWETARTVCPGHSLQSYMDRIRRRGQLG